MGYRDEEDLCHVDRRRTGSSVNDSTNCGRSASPAWCGESPGIQTYPCIPKPHWPNIKRFNMGGARPPLVDKRDVWSTHRLIQSNVRGVSWHRANTRKHGIRFWPDYYTHSFVSVVWNGTDWVQPRNPVWSTADCDV